MFMDPSRAFDSINHNLLVAKLEPYDFSGISLQLMRTYLKNCKQRVHVKGSFSESKTILTSVLQGSILGRLLFNIFLNDIFLFGTYLHQSNYADENTLHCFSNNIIDVNDKLKIDLTQIMELLRCKLHGIKC